MLASAARHYEALLDFVVVSIHFIIVFLFGKQHIMLSLAGTDIAVDIDLIAFFSIKEPFFNT
jgi:hypothetical protein